MRPSSWAQESALSKQKSDNPGKRNTNYLSFKTNYGYKDGLASMGAGIEILRKL